MCYLAFTFKGKGDAKSMDLDKFIQEVKAVNWHDFSGSDFYYPEKVAESLIALALANQETKEKIAYSAESNFDLLLNANISSTVLSAIGNNHCGSYYPVVRKALPFITQIALLGNHLVAKNCAINILIDLYYFCAECNDDSDSEEELTRFVKSTIKNTISENRNFFEIFAVDDPRNKSLIKSLLEIIE